MNPGVLGKKEMEFWAYDYTVNTSSSSGSIDEHVIITKLLAVFLTFSGGWLESLHLFGTLSKLSWSFQVMETRVKHWHVIDLYNYNQKHITQSRWYAFVTIHFYIITPSLSKYISVSGLGGIEHFLNKQEKNLHNPFLEDSTPKTSLLDLAVDVLTTLTSRRNSRKYAIYVQVFTA